MTFNWKLDFFTFLPFNFFSRDLKEDGVWQNKTETKCLIVPSVDL